MHCATDERPIPPEHAVRRTQSLGCRATAFAGIHAQPNPTHARCRDGAADSHIDKITPAIRRKPAPIRIITNPNLSLNADRPLFATGPSRFIANLAHTEFQRAAPARCGNAAFHARLEGSDPEPFGLRFVGGTGGILLMAVSFPRQLVSIEEVLTIIRIVALRAASGPIALRVPLPCPRSASAWKGEEWVPSCPWSRWRDRAEAPRAGPESDQRPAPP